MMSEDIFAKGGSVGIMQPYFFPYLGHFSLIHATDFWVIFDVSQYKPKSWMNRNRVLHPSKGWQYLTVPLGNSSISIKTKDARVKELNNTKINLLRKMEHYRKKAPFYSEVMSIVEHSFSRSITNSLVDLNISALEAVCSYLGLSFNYSICSELNIDFPSSITAGHWAPTIASKLGAVSYINPESGRGLFDKKEFEKLGIKLQFMSTQEFAYKTKGYIFEPNLSVLDVMFWCSPVEIKEAIENRYILMT